MARPTLGTHKKFKRLARRIRVLLGTECPVDASTIARGVLEALWLGPYESGDPVLGNPEDVAEAAGWLGDPEALCAALVDCGQPDSEWGFLERHGELYHVHDLLDHAPDYVKKRRKRERERKMRSDWSVTSQCPVIDQSTAGQMLVSDQSVTSTPAPAPAPARTPAPAQRSHPHVGAALDGENDLGEYAQAIWSAFCRASGKGSFAGRDAFEVIQAWADAGVPQQLACAVIAERVKPKHGRLSWARDAVLEAWQAQQQLGAPGAGWDRAAPEPPSSLPPRDVARQADWEQLAAFAEARIDPEDYRTWFSPLELWSSSDNGRLLVACPNEQFEYSLNQFFGSMLRDGCAKLNLAGVDFLPREATAS